MKNMSEEKKEMWGLTPASVISALGFITGIIPYMIKRFPPVPGIRMILAIVGIVIITAGIAINVSKGLKLKWRMINVILQCVMIGVIIAVYFFYR